MVNNSISSDGTIAAISDGIDIKFINMKTGKINRIFADRGINSLTFSPDGQNLISESGGKIRVWIVPK